MPSKARNSHNVSVKPTHYDLYLSGIEIDAQEPTYKGLVKIQVVVQKATDTIVLNAEGLDLLSAHARLSGGRERQASEISEDEDTQRCFLQFPEAFRPADLIEIVISFEAEIDDNLSGFFRFKDSTVASLSQGHECVASTQFQPCDARRAFPCFDEPAPKATFDFSIEVPPGLQALSNTPVPQTEPSKGKPGYDVIRFQRTPVMSTYLLARAIGTFDYLEAVITRTHSQTPLPIRVYCPPGLKSHAQFALKIACRTIEYFSEVRLVGTLSIS
jgi:aminopeptidase N